MILLPIGRDDSEIRRHAWVSYAIIALNVLAFIATGVVERSSAMEELENDWREAVVYLLRHPHAKVPQAMDRILEDPALARMLDAQRTATPPPSRAALAEQQKTLDDLAAEAERGLQRLPTFRFGYTPANGGIVPLFTSMFLHAGFLHLFGNLLFFFLSGPFIEDVFGRPLFAALYLAGGVAASMTYAARHPEGTVPLVGASGAIAAVMGAYLVRFLRSKVEFLFVPFLFRPLFNFRFFLPAFVVLPLWFGQQFLEMQSEAGGGGVAFSAHVGGFVFGVVAALMVKVSRFEEKYINPVVLQQTTWSIDPRLAEAMTMRAAGNGDGAKQALAALLREKPNEIDALRLAVDVARESDDLRMLDSVATRLLGVLSETKQNELAMELIHEIAGERGGPLLPKFIARAAVFADRSGDREWALYLYERAFDADPDGPNAVGSLVKIGTLLRASGDTARAREALTKARSHPSCTPDWAPSIDAKLAQL